MMKPKLMAVLLNVHLETAVESQLWLKQISNKLFQWSLRIFSHTAYLSKMDTVHKFAFAVKQQMGLSMIMSSQSHRRPLTVTRVLLLNLWQIRYRFHTWAEDQEWAIPSLTFSISHRLRDALCNVLTETVVALPWQLTRHKWQWRKQPIHGKFLRQTQTFQDTRNQCVLNAHPTMLWRNLHSKILSLLNSSHLTVQISWFQSQELSKKLNSHSCLMQKSSRWIILISF